MEHGVKQYSVSSNESASSNSLDEDMPEEDEDDEEKELYNAHQIMNLRKH